jgi:hypothetical protein
MYREKWSGKMVGMLLSGKTSPSQSGGKDGPFKGRCPFSHVAINIAFFALAKNHSVETASRASMQP